MSLKKEGFWEGYGCYDFDDDNEYPKDHEAEVMPECGDLSYALDDINGTEMPIEQQKTT